MRKSKAKDTISAKGVEDAAVSYSEESVAPIAEAPASGSTGRDMAVTTAATVAVVGVGAVVLEAALIPGLVLGVAAALAPQLAPRVGSALRPMFRGAVGHSYRLGRASHRAFAKAQHQVRGFVADVTADVGPNPASAAVAAPIGAE